MLRKNYFMFLTAIALLLVSSFAVSAQTAPVRGSVVLKKADGSSVPVAGAVVDVYRTDAKGKPPAGKTDKKGNFSFAGLLLGQTFAFVISAPGIEPQVFPNIRAGADDRVYTVYEGSGKTMTEAEARDALANIGKKPANPAPTNNTTGTPDPNANNQQAQKQSGDQGQPTPEQIAAAKKAQAEYEKQVAEINAGNEKIKNNTDRINKDLSEGREAFAAKNYDVAIAKFNDGIAADPEFAGTAPVLLNNKAVVLMKRATENYNVAVKNPDQAAKAAGMASVKSDYLEAIAASNKALALVKGNAAPDAAAQKNYDNNKYLALADLVELYRLISVTHADSTLSKETIAAYTEYMALETDAAKKAKAQLNLADILREDGDSDNAIAAYRKVLEVSPDNTDAMAGLGLSLFNAGASTNNKAQEQEGLNLMQRFVETAPDSHPLKASVKDAVEYLKSTEKLTPQKGSAPARKKS